MPELGSFEDQERKLERYRALDREEEMPTQAEDLLHYLKGEFQKGVPLRVTTRRSDAVGRALAEREVSRLEVLSALQQLPYRQRRVVELLYIESVPSDEVADRLGISERTVYSDRADALGLMANVIYEWES